MKSSTRIVAGSTWIRILPVVTAVSVVVVWVSVSATPSKSIAHVDMQPSLELAALAVDEAGEADLALTSSDVWADETNDPAPRPMMHLRGPTMVVTVTLPRSRTQDAFPLAH